MSMASKLSINKIALQNALAPEIVDNLLKALKDMDLSARRRFGGLTALLGAVILLAVSRYFS